MKIQTCDALATGRIIRSPVASEPGYWAGAPGIFYAADEQAWYLTYRIRRPRGVPPDRGGEVRIARSTDLEHWDDLVSITKDRFQSASIERCALHKSRAHVAQASSPASSGRVSRPDHDHCWRYFVSYVDPADGRWCVSVLKAGSIQNLAASEATPVFKARPLGLEGIKDPWIFENQGSFWMVLSVALPAPTTSENSHSTLDIFNTGECLSATGLARSRDLDHWEWQGVIFRPERAGWDRYCRRINCIIEQSGRYLSFYDGSASHAGNYEERTGLAVSSDLETWKTLTPDEPLFTSPHASGSLRYLDARMNGETTCLFYEFARPDGSHDLRLTIADSSSLPFNSFNL